MKISKYLAAFCPAIFLVALVGCTEIEDHPDGRTDDSEMFVTNRKTYAYMNHCYSWLLGYGMNYNGTMLAGCTDEAKDAWEVYNGITRRWNEGQLSPFSNPIENVNGNPENYGYYYQGIRACNIFLDNIATASVYSEDIRKSFKAQVLTLRAFYYLQLIKRYGGVPISTSSKTDYSKVQRATFGECAKQILADCQEAINTPDVEEWGWRSLDKENYRHVMTKAVCAAISSEVALYAASPLFNDGTISWKQAEKITREALQNCVNNGYELYAKQPSATAGYSPYDVYFYSRPDLPVVNDKETIMEAGQMLMWNYAGLPTTDGQSSAGACPSQEMVDAYEVVSPDGTQAYPLLNLEKPYLDEDHLKPNYTPEALALYNEANPYANRDPRLRASIYYNGSVYNLENGAKLYTYAGGNCALNLSNPRYTCTGYYTRKFAHYKSGRGGNLDGYFKEFRLGELYLNYAEAANEAATGKEAPQAAVDAVNKVRARVDMPALPAGMTRDAFRLRLRNERRVEFAFEEQRFFDVRRWKILGNTDRVVTGMQANTDGSCVRFVVDNNRKAYTDRYLLYPIPGDEAIRLQNTAGKNCQNPGW